ncbi:unnamed protein product [Prorocentrum cordatum]|nr:unnamed protein product [Polarella glacialis]
METWADGSRYNGEYDGGKKHGAGVYWSVWVAEGAEGARASADRLVRRLSQELEAARTVCARLRAVLDQRVAWGEGGVEAKAARREALARTSLVARLSGAPESGGKRPVQNVSLHAKRCPQAGAPWSEWKAAQRDGRLPGGAAVAAAMKCDVECEVNICEAEASLFTHRVEKLHVGPHAEMLRPGERQAFGEKHACPPCDVGVLMRELGVAAARTPLRSCAKPYLSENAAEARLPEGLVEGEAEAAQGPPRLPPPPPGGSEAAAACAAAPTAAASSAVVAEYLAAHPTALLSGGDGEEHFDEIEKPTCEEHEGLAERQEPVSIGFEMDDGRGTSVRCRAPWGCPKDDEGDQSELEAHVSGDGAGDEQGGGARASSKGPPSIIEEPTCEEPEGQAEQQEPEDIGFALNDEEEPFGKLRSAMGVVDVEAVAAAAARQCDCVEALWAIGMQRWEGDAAHRALMVRSPSDGDPYIEHFIGMKTVVCQMLMCQVVLCPMPFMMMCAILFAVCQFVQCVMLCPAPMCKFALCKVLFALP